MPFQFTIPHTEEELRTAKLVYLDEFTPSLILTEDFQEKMTKHTFGDYDVFVFDASEDLIEEVLEGRCFILLQFGEQGKEYFSEVITIVKSTDGYVSLEWRDSLNVEVGNEKMLYEGNDYKNILYLCTQIGMPDYEYTEEGENRDGHFFPLKQISEKVYKFTFVAPEFLCDALRLVPLADNVVVKDQFGVTYQAEQILISPKWLEQGNLAQVDVELHTNTIVKTIGKGYESPNT